MIRSTLACLMLAATSLVAAAQDGKPIEWVVGYAAGGGSDTVARATAEAMSKSLGAPIVINNKPGANTTRAAYWTPAQLVAHHAVNGCNLQPGDLLGSGTLSGPNADEAGSLMELTGSCKQPVVLANGERRSFLEDGDTLILRGGCERSGAVRIGLGECSGTVVAS